MPRTSRFSVRTIVASVSILLVGACEESFVPTVPVVETFPLPHVIACQADVASGTVRCGGLPGDPVPGLALSVIVGGQGAYVRLASANVGYDGSDVFQADVTVQNLIAQPLGTPDGSTVTGIKVFLHSGPTVTSGAGTVTVANADGAGTFTGTGQPYFEYDEILQTNETSGAKTWQWSVAPTVLTFEFSVYISADIPIAAGTWEVTPTPDFGTAEFTVNTQGSAITYLRFNFDSYGCGSVTLSGSVGFGSTWSITDRQFNIDHTDSFGDRFVFAGTFSALGDEASGTWGITTSGSTCSGTWEGAPEATAVIFGTISLADTYLAPQPARVAAAVRDVARPATPPVHKAVPDLAYLQEQRLPPPFSERRAEMPTDQLIVSFEAGPLAAPPIGSFAMASLNTAQGLVAGITSRLESSAPVVAGEAEVIGVSPVILAARVRVHDLSRVDEIAAALRSDPAVRRVRRHVLRDWRDGKDGPVPTPPPEPNDHLYEYQAWYHQLIDLPEAWEITTGSPSVLVAVVDDGTRSDHPDLGANLTSDGYDFVASLTLNLCEGGTFDNAGDGDGYDPDPTTPAAYSWDVNQQCGTVDDVGSHGSFVAGIIGAVGNEGVGIAGVNWSLAIRSVRALGVMGWSDEYEIAQAILYAAGLPADDGAGGVVQATSGASVINLSLGMSSSDVDLENAVISASNAGSLIVASAGNSASSGAHYPSDYPQVISVSAVGPDALLASYSNYGSNIDIAAPGGDFQDGVDMGHPGPGTFGLASCSWKFDTSDPIAVFGQGTSGAAPHVSGVAALLLSEEPSLTAVQLRARLLDYAVDMGTPGWDEEYGAGLLNARNSLTQSFAPPRDLYARLYNAGTGAIEETIEVESDGSYAFTDLADADYHVYAGQDVNGDQEIGKPGRIWGAHGGSAAPATITVAGAGDYPASFSVGYPFEEEPNNPFENANPLPLGGYTTGVMFEASDVFRVVIPQAGEYTFETSAANGYCGFALNEDTIMELYDSGFTLLAQNDDIDYSGLNWCSRITMTLQPGTYYTSLRGWLALGLPYQVEVRPGG